MFYFSCFRRPPTKTNKPRVRMTSWAAERSAILSLMLDEVSGTEEMVTIRQDFCRVSDCIESCGSEHGRTTSAAAWQKGWTSRAATGTLCMTSMATYNIRVAQTAQEARVASSPRICFSPSLYRQCPTLASLCWDGYLSLLLFLILSYYAHHKICTAFFISAAFSSRVNRLNAETNTEDGCTRVIQGPSIETWQWIHDNRSESGMDSRPLYPLSVLAARRGGMAPSSSSLRLADSDWYHSNHRFRLPSGCHWLSSLILQRNGMENIVFSRRAYFSLVF